MSHINNNISSAKNDSMEQYRLIIPENLVNFKEIYSQVLKNKELKIDVEEVGDTLNFDSISVINRFEVLSNIENSKKLLDKMSVVENIAGNIRAICDDDKLHNAVHVLKEIVEFLINYKEIEGSIYFFDVAKGCVKEASLPDIYNSSFIEKLERLLSEGKCKNGTEVVLVNTTVKEVVIDKICYMKGSGVCRPWLEDLIYPIKGEISEKIRKCCKIGIQYNYDNKEMYKVITERYVRDMSRKQSNGEYSEKFGRQLSDKEAFCGTEKTVYKATRVINRILKPIIVGKEGKGVIFPWLEFIDYVVKNVDERERSENFSQEYLSELTGDLYKEYKFCSKYKRYCKEKEMTEEISERKRVEIGRFLSIDRNGVV